MTIINVTGTVRGVGDALVTEAERLRLLVDVDPHGAVERARVLLDACGPGDALARARLQWVIGLGDRETGRLEEARAALAEGVAAAREGVTESWRRGSRRAWRSPSPTSATSTARSPCSATPRPT